MKRIQLLSTLVANQIAAGEVIERPASIVKELLENALDAKASSIVIEIGHGGLTSIKVSDDGVGIVADDLPLAILAHATSKIATLDDLYEVKSMGFRGEALASIASIAHITVTSKPLDQPDAMKLQIEGSHQLLTPCARALGTTVEVRDIFYNAPVRKKFLKSKYYEFQAIELMVKRFALSVPEVSIELFHDHKPVLILPATDKATFYTMRVGALLGKKFIDNAIAIDTSSDDITLKGWTTHPNYQRSQSDRLWVYINQRIIKDKLINHAIKLAYDNHLHPGRFPLCILYLTVNPHEIDVNVHPTKHEIRFQNPKVMHNFLYNGLKKAIQEPTTQPYADTMRASSTKNFLREPHLGGHYTPFSFRTALASEQEGIYIAQNYIIYALTSGYCLIDMVALKRHWLTHELNQADLPLSPRHLLVAIDYALPHQFTATAWQQLSPLFSQLGFDIMVDKQRIWVRAIPHLFPDLVIDEFVESACKLSIYTLDALKEILLNITCAKVTDLSAKLKTYLEHYQSTLIKEPFIKVLTAKHCERILYE
ncbi:MAG: DNA mismatch repair protein MutL [Legionellaceae bacterium]|nr:DNA mismatch repair protein MutL [Legionellaceae bacterium]|tara:strand:+ start:737 stop:2353 length:1617 start_codon:yes stop_codon:yes gene_type:complete